MPRPMRTGMHDPIRDDILPMERTYQQRRIGILSFIHRSARPGIAVKTTVPAAAVGTYVDTLCASAGRTLIPVPFRLQRCIPYSADQLRIHAPPVSYPEA